MTDDSTRDLIIVTAIFLSLKLSRVAFDKIITNLKFLIIGLITNYE